MKMPHEPIDWIGNLYGQSLDAFTAALDEATTDMAAASDMPPIEFQKNSVAIRISREMAIDLGMTEPTPEERATRDTQMAQYREREAERQARYEVGLVALAAADEVTRAVLELHAPVEQYGRRVCEGCDMDGYEAESPEWPCRTVEVLAKANGLDMSYEGDQG